MRPIQPLAVHHKTFTLDEFIAKLPELKKLGQSMMYYMFPFENLITVEFRSYNPGAKGDPDGHVWPLRNYMWATSGPAVCAQAERDIPIPAVRYKIIDGLSALWRFNLENLIKSDNTVATDQIIRYPAVADASKLHLQPVGLPRRKSIPPCWPSISSSPQSTTRQRAIAITCCMSATRILKDQQCAVFVFL